MEFSTFGNRLTGGSGIEELMDDLGNALVLGGPETRMLGGGQPARIPELTAIWKERLEAILAEEGGVDRLVGSYDPPRGNPKFLSALAALLHESFGWNVTSKNLAITNGGQTAFFFLFNALAGTFPDGSRKKVLLPLVPEYIGYANQSIGSDFFKAVKPKIEKIGDHQFKYRVDFDALEITDDISAICVSRPTNPTGNVLTDNEIKHLADIAKENGIPLIIDNAYGAPFPNIFFADANPYYDDHVILTMSLSKIGLPGTRTGIVMGSEKVAGAVASMTAIAGLANGNVGQTIMAPLVESGEILRLSREVVKPFYLEKSKQAQAWVSEYFDDELPYRMHLSEGALFLWLHFEGMPISSEVLYERLKARGVLIVSGHYFFFGLDEEWQHASECIRMTYTMAPEIVEDGIRIIAEEVAKAYQLEGAPA
ncbi:MAG: valine--pyruvate transaminase [Verrucomicrobiales bacterium]|nr:valine--pyruvate transaminase [Verrucomicrobiales bacterium]